MDFGLVVHLAGGNAFNRYAIYMFERRQMAQNEEMKPSEETEENEETEDVYEELDPREVAGILMDKLIHKCEDDPECTPLPDDEDALYIALDYCLGSTVCDIDPEAEEAIEKSKTFRDELEKEFREMLNDFWAYELSNPGYGLSHVLDKVYYNIADKKHLVNFRKAKLLKKYQKVLEDFVDAIDRALKEKKPLSKKDLYNWFMDIGDTVLGTEAYDWFDLQVDNWLSFYDSLKDDYKLVMLLYLKDNITEGLLPKIKQKISELEGLTNSQ
jgi:hypothetical protein